MTTSTEIVDGAVSMLQDRCRLLEESLRTQVELLATERLRVEALEKEVIEVRLHSNWASDERYQSFERARMLAVLLADADWALAQAVEMARKIAQEGAVLREVFIGPVTQAALDRHAARHKGVSVSLERVAP